MPEPITWLPPLVLLENFNGDWHRYLNALYNFFKHDFVDSKPQFQGFRFALKKHPTIDGKEATFWHLISSGREENGRIPDLRRCERIRWPRPVIEHFDCDRIKVWKNKRKREIRICLWLEEKEYLVVLAERKDYVLLWTAYLVIQKHQKLKLLKEYEAYKNAEAAS